MPGGLHRQNAFSEYYGSKTFTELQCHICKQYESDGDWIKIQCRCHTMPASPEYAYTHRYCLNMSGQCKQCGQAYTQRKSTSFAATTKPTTTITTTTLNKPQYKHIISAAFMRKYRAQLTLFVCCIIGLSICYDALDCITIDLLEKEELQGLTDADFLYLPVGSS